MLSLKAWGVGLVTAGQGLVSEIIPGFLEIYSTDRGHTAPGS